MCSSFTLGNQNTQYYNIQDAMQLLKIRMTAPHSDDIIQALVYTMYYLGLSTPSAFLRLDAALE